MSSDDAPLVIAERYEIKRPIGQGGMGAVFEAVHVHTGRRLAVKTLLGRYVDDPVLVERFMREARATTAIADPHVVEIVDIGRTPEGDVFMVMELLEGRELKRAMREDAPMPVARACYVCEQIAAVMGKAHARGIVHRDLKPANVFLVPRDRDPDYVKVLDFGIAKLDKAALGEGADGHTMTRTGQLIGTPSYMSPEQLQGLREVDARSDVYALGVILYQMLAGELPIKGESIPDIFLKVMTTEPPPLRALRPAVPEALASLVHRALRREASERFEDCAAFAAALAPFAAQWVVGSPPTAADTVASAATVMGAHRSSPSGLSDPVHIPSSAVSVRDSIATPGGGSSARSPAPWVAAGAVVVATLAGVAVWRPWSSGTAASERDATRPAQVARAAAAAPDAARVEEAALDASMAHAPDATGALATPDAAVARIDAARAARPRARPRPTEPEPGGGLILTTQ